MISTSVTLFASTAPPWPSPRRPTPSIILHSSGSTNKPKLLRLSLQYWAENLETHSKLLLSSDSSSSEDVNRTRLLASPAYWHTFTNLLVLHLATRVPVALVHSDNIRGFTPLETMEWLAASESRQIVTSALSAREMLCLAFDLDGTVKDDRWAAVLTSLNTMGITGSDIDEELSEFFVKCNVKAMVSICITRLD
jgi:acyl-coenzyme A synthetase/AMP-(fatty) acid ligase